jgi:hypothetical protein
MSDPKLTSERQDGARKAARRILERMEEKGIWTPPTQCDFRATLEFMVREICEHFPLSPPAKPE